MQNSLKPVLIVIAGPNGSGKTSITSQILKHEWVRDSTYINPDNIAENELGGWNSSSAILEAAQIASKRREECIANKESLIFETVFSAIDKVDFLERAKKAGYFIRLFFVGTEHPSINAKRIAYRVMEGGHDVPILKIVSRYYKSITNCCVIADIVDKLYIYDNSEDFAEAKLLFRATNGKIEKIYNNINNWAKPIFNICN